MLDYGMPKFFQRSLRAVFDRVKRIIYLFKDSYSAQKQQDIRKTHEELAFMPAAIEVLETPPSFSAHALMMIICAFFFITIAWSWFSYVETESVANGKIIPVGKIKQIQSLIAGRVAVINVQEGDRVEKGQLLIKLNPTEQEVDTRQVREQLTDNELSFSRLILLLEVSETEQKIIPTLKDWLTKPENHQYQLSGFPSEAEWVRQQKMLHYDFMSFSSKDEAFREEIKQKNAAINAINAEIKRLSILTPLHKENEKAVHSLMIQGHASRLDWLGAREKQVDMEQQMEVQLNHHAEAVAELAVTTSEHKKFHKEYRQERMQKLDELNSKIKELQLSLIKAEERDRSCYITAPVSGTVQQLSVFSEGSVVQPGSNIMIIVPDNTLLEVEAMVENKDIGFIQQGMPVDIKFETFPYTFYGYLNGSVRQVSEDAIELPDQGMFYPVYVTLDRQSVNINGAQQKLRVGMSVSAELRTGSRRLLAYFMEPFFRYRDETLTER